MNVFKSSAGRVDLRMAVMALGFTSGQYSNPQANTTALGSVTRPVLNHQFNNIILQNSTRLRCTWISWIKMTNIWLCSFLLTVPMWFLCCCSLCAGGFISGACFVIICSSSVLLLVPRLYFVIVSPESILHKSAAGRCRPISVADGPITTRCRFIKMLAGSLVPSLIFWSSNVISLCWFFTAQSTNWGHVERGQFN